MNEQELKEFLLSGSEESKKFLEKISKKLFKQKLNELGFDVVFDEKSLTGKII